MGQRSTVRRETVLIQAAQKGDKDAANELVIQYEGLCRKFALKFFADKDIFDDAMQEARLVVFNCISKFDTGRGIKFMTYLYAAVYHAMIQLKRKNRYREIPSGRTGIVEGDQRHVDDKELCALILESVSSRDREILVALSSGDSQKQVAARFKLSYEGIRLIEKKIGEKCRGF